MQLSLIDLLVILGLFICGSLGTSALLNSVHSTHIMTLSLLGGIVAVLGLTWPIYKRFHFRPLCFPVCPNCRRMPDAYGLAYARWPRAVIVCTICEAPLEVWMTRILDVENASTEMPSFSLRWPEFIGIWRRIH